MLMQDKPLPMQLEEIWGRQGACEAVGRRNHVARASACLAAGLRSDNLYESAARLGGWSRSDGRPWVRVTESDTRIVIETDKLEAAIPKRDPKHWMTGIEKARSWTRPPGFAKRVTG
jgi:hypothetical protein